MHALADRVAHGELRPMLDVLMGHVEEVWGRLSFRTPWSKAREGERVRSALERFLSWHAANARTVLDTESRFQAEVELDDGERVVLTGAADRLELAADGSVVVVDLKTSKYAPSGPACSATSSSASTSTPSTPAPSTHCCPRVTRARGPGEPSWSSSGCPATRPTRRCSARTSRVTTDRSGGRCACRSTARRPHLRAESFPAVAGPHCRECSFVPLCPVKSAGAVTSR